MGAEPPDQEPEGPSEGEPPTAPGGPEVLNDPTDRDIAAWYADVDEHEPPNPPGIEGLNGVFILVLLP